MLNENISRYHFKDDADKSICIGRTSKNCWFYNHRTLEKSEINMCVVVTLIERRIISDEAIAELPEHYRMVEI